MPSSSHLQAVDRTVLDRVDAPTQTASSAGQRKRLSNAQLMEVKVIAIEMLLGEEPEMMVVREQDHLCSFGEIRKGS